MERLNKVKKPYYQLNLKEQKMSKRSLMDNYFATSEYLYSRCRGIILHQAMKIFITEHLINLSLLFDEKISFYKLWYHLNREVFRSLFESIHYYRNSLPQIKEWKGEIILESMNAIKVLIRRIFNVMIKRLQKGHQLEHIIEDITPLIQEKNMSIRYKGFIIHFKPDWIEYELNRAVILDFKTGYYSRETLKKDRLQILLFAFCFSKYRKIIIDRCEIHYLSQGKCEIIKINEKIMNHIKIILDLFIYHKISVMKLNQNSINLNITTGINKFQSIKKNLIKQN